MTDTNDYISQPETGHSDTDKMLHNAHVLYGVYEVHKTISKGLEEDDMGEVGLGVASGGLLGLTSATTITATVTTVCGAAAGLAAAIVVAPVATAALVGGLVLWGLNKILD
jgi:hypothetical protein